MTWKDILLVYWILWVVLSILVVRHFFNGVLYLMEHVASAIAFCTPCMLHLFSGYLQ